MEKWKMGAIALLILSFGGFAALQNNSGNTASEPQPASDGGQSNNPTGQQATPNPLTALIGTKPVPWNFPQTQWVNTKRPFTPKDLQGKVTVLEFWRMMCSHCQEAVPFMNSLQKNYGPRGLQIITFQSPGALPDPLRPNDAPNPETNWKTVQAWIQAQGATYPVAFDDGRKVKNGYNIEFYPLVIVVDRKGVIRYAHTGHTDDKARALITAIEAELNKPK